MDDSTLTNSMELFVFDTFAIFSYPSLTKSCEFSTFQEFKACLSNIPSGSFDIRIRRGKLIYTIPSTYDKTLWKKLLYDTQNTPKTLLEWGIPFKYTNNRDPNERYTFHEFMLVVWSPKIVPVRPKLLETNINIEVLEHPFEYLQRELKDVLEEYYDEDDLDIPTLILVEDVYTKLVGVLGQDFGETPEVLSKILIDIAGVFDTFESLKLRWGSKEVIDAEIRARNEHNALTNTNNIQAYDKKMELYMLIKNIIGTYYRSMIVTSVRGWYYSDMDIYKKYMMQETNPSSTRDNWGIHINRAFVY